ncbi:DUF58 domain-containing protein [Planococcus sp. YIM B11945]|uniref:DUF58 domain-containing protein n=1 Tax=Planococcus sp. YIM B11945 TaxID=3435410 RepID=UPI003D7DC5E0
MEWLRHDYDMKGTRGLMGLLLVFFVIALAILQFEAAAVLAFIGVIALLQWLYFEKVGNQLVFHNFKNRKRVLNGGDSSWDLQFENSGLPIWGGTLKITFQDSVLPKGNEATNFTETIELDIPFTIGWKQSVLIKVPLTGKRRGLSRILKMELVVPHLFAEGSAVLEYKPMVLHEQLVYPRLQKFPFRTVPTRQKPGHFDLKHSLFDDVFQPIGTRDYVPTDQFNQIHWKASARLQSYQTKVYSKVTNESLLFALDVASGYSTIYNLEDRIEELAAYVEQCYKENVPYAIAINIRSAGKMPYFYLATASGQMQRQKALELLSVVSKNHSALPFRSMLAHIDIHLELPFTTYLLTDEAKDIQRFIGKWSRQTHLSILKSRNGGISA